MCRIRAVVLDHQLQCERVGWIGFYRLFVCLVGCAHVRKQITGNAAGQYIGCMVYSLVFGLCGIVQTLRIDGLPQFLTDEQRNGVCEWIQCARLQLKRLKIMIQADRCSRSLAVHDVGTNDMAVRLNRRIVGKQQQLVEHFAALVVPLLEQQHIKQRIDRRRAFGGECYSTIQHANRILGLPVCAEEKNESAFFQQHCLFFGADARVDIRLQKRDDVFCLVVGARNPPQLVNCRPAEVIRFECFQIANVCQFFMAGMLENTCDRQLNRAFPCAVPRFGMTDFIVISRNDIIQCIWQILIFLEIDVVVHGIYRLLRGFGVLRQQLR